MKFHDFKVGQYVTPLSDYHHSFLTTREIYRIVEAWTWDINVVDKDGRITRVSANTVQLAPVVTMTKGHLRRIIMGG